MIAKFRRLISLCLIVSISGLAIPMPAHAALLQTEAAIASSERARINDFLARSDVRDQLQAYGIDADYAKARVAALTDEEVAQIAGRMEQMPAGGDAVGAIIGVAVLVFIVLLITDILGLTKVFPFTKSIR